MDRTRNRKFMTYNALQLALRKECVSNHGSVARILLECFLEDGGRLQASKVIARGICEEGRFSLWRDELVKNNWLVWTVNQADKGQYYAGKKLLAYINKEKMSSKEIATKDDVVATRDEVADLRSQLNSHEKRLAKIDEAVQELRLAVEPPETEEKRKTRERVAEKLSKLALASN